MSTIVMPVSTRTTMNCHCSSPSVGPIFTGKSNGTAPPSSGPTPQHHNHTRPGPTGTGFHQNVTYATGTGCACPMPTATGSWSYVWSMRPTPTPTPSAMQFMASAPSVWNTNSRMMIGGLAAFVGGMIMVRLECTLRLCLTIVDDMFVRFCDFIPMGKSDIIVFRARRCQRAIWVCRCCNPDRDYTGDMWKAVLILPMSIRSS